MTLLIGFLTFILVLNCVLLMLLVLMQLPKKEAGAGLAFGGGASDALFGAGSGTAMTQLTKYVATTFMALALVVAVLNSRRAEVRDRTFDYLMDGEPVPERTVPAPPPDSGQPITIPD